MDVIRNCLHYTTCDDYSGGCVVCMDCGLVLETQLFSDPLASPFSYQSKSGKREEALPSKKTSEKTLEKITSGKELILTVCRRHELTDFICRQASELFHDYIRQKAKRGVQIDEALYAGLALYNACCQNNVARSKAEIAGMLFINVKKLNRLESDFRRGESYIDHTFPSKLLPRISVLTNEQVSYKTCVALATLADELYETMCATPNSVLGYVLYEYLNSSYFQTLQQGPAKKYSLVYVASMCGITPSCIQRIIRLKGRLEFDSETNVLAEA